MSAATPQHSNSTLIRTFLDQSRVHKETRATRPPRLFVQPQDLEQFDTTMMYQTTNLRHSQHDLPTLPSGQGNIADARYDQVLDAHHGEQVLDNQARLQQDHRGTAHPLRPQGQAAQDVEDSEDSDTDTESSGDDEISEEILQLVENIRSVKVNKRGLPMRVPLKQALPEHFDGKSRLLSKKSPLYDYLGDTRLFTEEEWIYLTTAAKRKMEVDTESEAELELDE